MTRPPLGAARNVSGPPRRALAACAGLLAGVVLALAGSANAAAATAGILPPKNPSADCRGSEVSEIFTLSDIGYCRALEGVGALVLPRNWSSLTPSQQAFVIVDLERVNRGRAPIVALTGGLDTLAHHGAANGNDPSVPSGLAGGAIWAGADSVLGADDEWMYYDGLRGLDFNLACRGSVRWGCWLHRDIILWGGTGGKLYAGSGYAYAGGTSSYALEIVAGLRDPHPVFTWASELRYFAVSPQVERTRVMRRTKR